MPVNLTPTFASSEFFVRYKEPDLTASLNKKLAVNQPPGTYRGFRLEADPGLGDRTVRVKADATFSDHVAVVQTQTGFSVSVRKEGGSYLVALTDAGLLGMTVVLALHATYAVGVTTAVVLRAYTLAEYDALSTASRVELVVLGTVIVPGAPGAIAAASITHDRRTGSWESTAVDAVEWSPLLRNPSFEWGVDGDTLPAGIAFWDINSIGFSSMGIDSSQTAANTGIRSSRWRTDGSNSPGNEAGVLRQLIGVPVSPGQLVKFEVFKKVVEAPVAPVGTLKFKLVYGDASMGATVVDEVTIDHTVVDASFVRVTGIRTVPATARFLRDARLELELASYISDPTRDVFFVDDVQVWLETASPFKTDLFENRVLGPVWTPQLVIGSWTAALSELAALLDFNPSSPSGEGALRLIQRNFTGLPPALNLVGRLFGLGNNLVGTDANAQLPRISSTSRSTSGRKTLIWEWSPSGVTIKQRLYHSAAGDLEFTTNAVWSNSLQTFSKDDTAQSSAKIALAMSIVGVTIGRLEMFFRPSGAGSWGDTIGGWGVQTLGINQTDPSANPANALATLAGGLILGNELGGTAGEAEQFRLRTQRDLGAGLERTLLWDFRGSGHHLRLYSSSDDTESLELTVNAVWNNTTNQWSKDNAALNASKVTFSRTNIRSFRRSTTSGTWAEDAAGWNEGFPSITVGLQSNPFSPSLPQSAAKNSLFNQNLVKAWGKILTGGGSPVLVTGQEVSAVSYLGNPASVQVDLVTSYLSTGELTPIVCLQNANPLNRIVMPLEFDANTFIIQVVESDGTQVDLDAVTMNLNFVVMGRQ